MTAFLILATVLVLFCMALIIVPMTVKSRASTKDISDKDSNVAYFREQASELQAQVEQGLMAEQDAEAIRLELEKKLLNDMAEKEQEIVLSGQGRSLKQGVLLALLVPLMALPFYFKLGASTELAVTEKLKDPMVTREEIMTALERWHDERPNNVQALFMLAGRYIADEQLDQGVEAYRRLYQLTQGSSQIAAELANALYLVQEKVMTDEIRQLYSDALIKDEANATALKLKGIDAFNQEKYRQAIAVWSQALPAEYGFQARAEIESGIREARIKLGEKVAEVRVQISLAPELENLPGNTRVVVFARESGVRKPPVVAIPLFVADLPKEVVLDDTSSRIRGGKLGDLETLDLVARITLSGDVSEPDYQGEVKSIRVGGSSVVQLEIKPAS